MCLYPDHGFVVSENLVELVASVVFWGCSWLLSRRGGLAPETSDGDVTARCCCSVSSEQGGSEECEVVRLDCSE